MNFSPREAIIESGKIGMYCDGLGLSPVDKAAQRFLHMRSRVIGSTDLSDIFEIGNDLSAEMTECYPEAGTAIAKMRKDSLYKEKMYVTYLTKMLPALKDDL